MNSTFGALKIQRLVLSVVCAFNLKTKSLGLMMRMTLTLLIPFHCCSMTAMKTNTLWNKKRCESDLTCLWFEKDWLTNRLYLFTHSLFLSLHVSLSISLSLFRSLFWFLSFFSMYLFRSPSLPIFLSQTFSQRKFSNISSSCFLWSFSLAFLFSLLAFLLFCSFKVFFTLLFCFWLFILVKFWNKLFHLEVPLLFLSRS